MAAIAILHKDEILKRVAKGDKIADIDKTYGVSHAEKVSNYQTMQNGSG